MSPTNKITMLRLRNRVLNRFKAAKKARATPKTKAIQKKSISILTLKSGKKCLRVIPFSDRVTVSSEKLLSQTCGQKVSSPHRIGARTVASLISSRRICLRNRRLMSHH